MQLERIYQLDFKVNADGSIDLEQPAGLGEVDRITLHACHVRHLFEQSGYLLPQTPGDKTSKRLARQLVEVHSALSILPDYDKAGLAVIVARLGGFVEGLPDSLSIGEKPEPIASTFQSEQGERPDFQLIKE